MALAGSAPKGSKATEKMPGDARIQGVALARGNDVYDGKDNYAPYLKGKVDRSARSAAAKSLLNRGNK